LIVSPCPTYMGECDRSKKCINFLPVIDTKERKEIR
jgi:hypothetical protein